jgi:phage terminase small subunit
VADAEETHSQHKKLEPRQRAFVREYLHDCNAMQAAIRAGYSPEAASSYSAQLMALPHIKAAIAAALAQRLSRTQVTQDSVLHEMSLLANSQIEHYVIDNEGHLALAEGAPEGAMGAVKSFRKKIRKDKDGSITYDCELQLWDKPGSLKLMGRHTGLFPDKVEVSGPGGKPLEVVTRVERVIIDAKRDPS